jgi:2-hydroxy-3-keto-5-methylthiopentenyl-1-phosphate phosphatase
MKNKYAVFMDFDGTITTKDVGYEMFRKFTGGKTQSVVDKYRRGEVNSYTCLKSECEIWNRVSPSRKEVFEFLDKQSIAEGFDRFIGILRRSNIRHYILSEGFNFYIDFILKTNGLSPLDRITNNAAFIGGNIIPEFPYLEKGCGECSNCKGFHIRELTDPKNASVFIGDGHSDFHGAGAADIVFAKSFLKEALEKIGRNYLEYEDFCDIINAWNTISRRKVFTFSEDLYFCSVVPERHRKIEELWETGEVMANVGYPGGLGWSKQRYDEFWKSLGNRNFVLLALEDEDGKFLGEAKLSFPDESNICSHDVKILPEYQGRGFGRKAWRLLLELSYRRWPGAKMSVTPSLDNEAAIRLYKSIGFEFDGDQQEWIPSQDSSAAVPVRYRKMIK